MSEEFEKEITEMTNAITNIAANNAEGSPVGGKVASILGAARTPEAAQVLKMAIDQELAEQKAAMGIVPEEQSVADDPRMEALAHIQDRLDVVRERDEKLFGGSTVEEVQNNNMVVTQDVIDAGIPESETTVSAPEEPMVVELPKEDPPEVVYVNEAAEVPTEEKKVVTIDDENSGMEPITETFEDYMERHKDDESIADIEIKEDTAADVIKSRYTDMSFDDAKQLALVLKQWQNKEISSLEAYNAFPPFMTVDFNAQLLKAGVPFKEQNNHKKEFAKSVLEDLATSTQMQQATNDVNEQISQIYAQYGDDVNVLYQAGIYEKINSMKKAAEAMEAEQYTDKENREQPAEVWEENKKRKVEDMNLIVEALYETFRLEKFAKKIGHIKAKKIDLTDTKRCFSNFNAKYARSKFSVADVSTIVPVLEQYCEFTHDQAVEFAVVFCEYCRNMRPNKIHEHVFMYYTIANINSLSISVGDKAAKFANCLINNIKALMAIHEAKGDGSYYVAQELSEDEVNDLLNLSSDIMKDAEQEVANEQEAAKAEEGSEAVSETAEEARSSGEHQD